MTIFQIPNKGLKLSGIICVLLGLPASAALANDTFTAMETDKQGVYWAPDAAYQTIALTVSAPDGQVFSKRFNSTESPYFSGPYTDGQYNYELRIENNVLRTEYSGKAGQKLSGEPLLTDQNGRLVASSTKSALGAHAAHKSPRVQAGAFLVINGLIVSQDVSEHQ